MDLEDFSISDSSLDIDSSSSNTPNIPTNFHTNKIQIKKSSSSTSKKTKCCLNSNQSPLIKVLSNTSFNYFLLFNFAFTFCNFMPSIFIISYGARWFSNCNPSSPVVCVTVNYASFNFYNSLSISIRGVIAFFCAGFVGRLSDSYGRKYFLIAHPFLYLIQILPLLISQNFLWYLILYPLSGITGASLGLSPLMAAYISDILPLNLRTIGYAISYASAGVALLLSAGTALMVSIYLSTYANFIIICILYILQIIYVYVCIPESLNIVYRKIFYCYNANPFRPLTQIRNNPIIFWISMIQFFITFMEIGIINISLIFILTQLHLETMNDTYVFVFTFITAASVGLFFGTIVILPLSRRYAVGIYCLKLCKLLDNGNGRRMDENGGRMNENGRRMDENGGRMDENGGRMDENGRRMDYFNGENEMDVDFMDDDYGQRLQPVFEEKEEISNEMNFNERYNYRKKYRKRINLRHIVPLTPPVRHTYIHYGVNRNELRIERNWNLENIEIESIADDRKSITSASSFSSVEYLQDNEQYDIYNDDIWIDFNNLLLGIILSFVSLVIIALIAFVHNMYYIAFTGVVVGLGIGLTFPSANGLATNSLRKDEQGKGFGIIYAVKGITAALAPIAFGVFYNYLVDENAGPVIFVMGMLLTVVAGVFIIWPLRLVLIDSKGAYKRKNFIMMQNYQYRGNYNKKYYT